MQQKGVIISIIAPFLTTMKIFSVPLNPKLTPDQYVDFYNFLIKYKDFIRDVYFTCRIPPFTQDAMGDLFVYEEDYSYAIEAALNIQQLSGIPVSATFNNTQIPPTQTNLDIFIKNFKPWYDKGIRNVTIPHTHWMATGQIKAAFPELFVKNTILREVHTAQEVVNLAKYGFDYINLDRDMMRDRDTLLKIKKAKKYIKETMGKDIAISLLANEGCAGGCSMMVEHFEFNNTRTADRPQYFNDPISRVSCPKWDVEDPAIFLKMANFPPWKADWDEFITELGIDSIKMHGRESIKRLTDTMDIIRRYANNEEILFDGFENYLEETNLVEKPINVWREKIKNCKFECWDCQYCDKIYDKKAAEIKYSELAQHTVDAIAKSGIPTTYVNIPGLTSPRVQTLLNNLAQGVDTYLEVGAAMGATFCAVLKDNLINAIAVDNWKENIQPANPDRATLPENRIETFIENVKQYKGNSKVAIYDGDIFAVDPNAWANSIKMFFYDGPHDKETTSKAVMHYWPAFAEEAILVFDDANWNGVVDGAREGINAAGGLAVFDKMILNSEENPQAWWNGVYVVVVRKQTRKVIPIHKV